MRSSPRGMCCGAVVGPVRALLRRLAAPVVGLSKLSSAEVGLPLAPLCFAAGSHVHVPRPCRVRFSLRSFAPDRRSTWSCIARVRPLLFVCVSPFVDAYAHSMPLGAPPPFCTARREEGTGKIHAKWSPVGTASYRLLPVIELTEPVTGERARRLQKCFSPGVVALEKNSQGEDSAIVSFPLLRRPLARREACR